VSSIFFFSEIFTLLMMLSGNPERPEKSTPITAGCELGYRFYIRSVRVTLPPMTIFGSMLNVQKEYDSLITYPGYRTKPVFQQ
jgi:hypothetical protein